VVILAGVAAAVLMVHWPVLSAGALCFAEQACRLTARRESLPLDTLAVAYAEAGRYEAARQTAREAIQLAYAQEQPQLAEQIRTRMRKYPLDAASNEAGNGSNP